MPGWSGNPGPAPDGPEAAGRRPNPTAARRIDIQRAQWYEWTLLDGIGESRARRIVSFRQEHGGFRSLEDLEMVPGMPWGWTEKIRDQLEVPADPSPRTDN